MTGYHLICDGFLKQKINQEKIKEILERVAEMAEMEIINGPHIVEGKKDNPGWTGICIIDFSHIAFHTFENEMVFSFDLYSCKEFSETVIVDYLNKVEEIKNFNQQFFRRQVI